MDAMMMNFPLTLNHILERAGDQFGDVEVVSQLADRSLRRDDYRTILARTRALAQGLVREGLEPGDRVATLMWNHYAHLEVYFGAPMAGGVYHTLNLRLSPDDLSYIINHARDSFLIVDDVLLPLLNAVRDRIDVERIFVVGLKGEVPEGMRDYEELLQGAEEDWEPPALDEDQAAGLCYTSGTTGRPKGVLYSHRALVLHSLASALPDQLGVGQRDVLVPVVPMFHANAWGLPFTCALAGCKQVLPGPHLDGESLLDLYERESVTITAGVPTIWMGILQQLRANRQRWSLHEGMTMIVGGAAAPESMIRAFDEFGLQVVHAWGMTELSPLGTVSRIKSALDDADEDTKYALRAKQGLAAPFVELRVVGDEGPVPHDGASMGELQCRGPWVASGYFGDEERDDKWTPDGWFRTGDVVTIDEHGYVQITDRTKDLIKSGGEWISSVELENTLMAHEAIEEAAVVAIHDAKWGERPLALIVEGEGAQVSDEELGEFLVSKGIARWWLPDVYVRREEVPKGATGKFLKSAIREEFWDIKSGQRSS